jgi:hypothetical protein
MWAGRLSANLCCDREARVVEPAGRTYWSYSNMLSAILPSGEQADAYDPGWRFYNGPELLERLGGYYKGAMTSRNGVYHNHGMQTPLVPHAFTNAAGHRIDRVFTHRSNAIIGLGPVASKTALGVLPILTQSARSGRPLSGPQLQARLDAEVQRMMDLFAAHGTGGFLKPAYINDGGSGSNATIMPEQNTYFRVPADTLYTLAATYPRVSSHLRPQLLSYLSAYWQRYFAASPVRFIGWSAGTLREFLELPPEVASRMAQLGDVSNGTMPQRVFYAAWRYAQLVPSQAATIYATVRPLLVNPPPSTLDIVRGPGVYNDYIAGYQGFLNLYDMLGTNPEPALRASVAANLTSLLNTRLVNFAKDHPWRGTVDNPDGLTVNQYMRRFNCTRNFLYLTPELGQSMRASAQASTIAAAIDEYTYVCPQWFIARDHNTFQEGAAHHIFDSHALFLAKAFVQRQSQAELSKWIDVPWMFGDLYYIQNLVAALEAGNSTQ